MIPIARPYFDAADEAALVEPLRSGWVVQGPRVAAFERRIADYADVPTAVATSSCTTALELALLACGVGPGDDVVLPAFTFVATANVVEHLGARPVFADIDLATYNMDAPRLHAALTPATRAVVPVHLFGLCATMEPILALAAARGLRVVEDAACALGAFAHGRHAGSFGDAGCLSFHARKVITTGEGGMILTRDAELGARARALREHGAVVDDFRRHETGQTLLPDYIWPGYNARMTDLQAALGLSQADKLGWLLERRAALAARYTERLSDLDWLGLPAVPAGFVHGWQSYVCLVRPRPATPANLEAMAETRRALMRHLRERGVDTRQGTHAVHLLQYYAERYKLEPAHCPGAWLADGLTISLPLYPGMTEAEHDQVVEAVRSFVP